jgi:hypothetical protein
VGVDVVKPRLGPLRLIADTFLDVEHGELTLPQRADGAHERLGLREWVIARGQIVVDPENLYPVGVGGGTPPSDPQLVDVTGPVQRPDDRRAAVEGEDLGPIDIGLKLGHVR